MASDFVEWIGKLQHSDTLEIAAWYDVWRDVTELLASQHEALLAAKILFDFHNIESDTITDRTLAAAEAFKEKYGASL